MSYTTDTNSNTTGWGVGLSAIIGGALGYWAGRSSYPGFGGPMPYPAAYPGAYAAPIAAGVAAAAVDNSHCRTCYQEGMETGQQLAGLNFTAQRAAANGAQMRNYAQQLGAQLNSTLATINNRFDALNQQKIADQAAQIASLRTQNLVGINAANTAAQLNCISDKLNSITAGCAVRAVPGCPPVTTCACAGN